MSPILLYKRLCQKVPSQMLKSHEVRYINENLNDSTIGYSTGEMFEDKKLSIAKTPEVLSFVYFGKQKVYEFEHSL